MSRLKKILITPYFGKFPSWMGRFQIPHGYDWLLDCDLDGFKKRVRDKLGIECPVTWGSSKGWDYRCTLGLLYEEELSGYDFWGTCDFDVVFGNVDKWFPDEQINELDIWSNHNTYVCGFWTLYRNSSEVNNLFMQYEGWKEKMIFPQSNGWVEKEFSRTLEQSGLRYRYSMFQGDPFHPPFNLKKVDGKLYQDGEEIAMLHFRRDKRWPL